MKILGYSLFIMVLAFSWRYEQPSVLHTLLLIACVFLLGLAVIWFAERNGIVLSQDKWLTAFSLKMALTLCLTTWFWAAPLVPQGCLRDIVQDTECTVQDSVIYDYNGARLAEIGFFDPNAGLDSVWLDFGIVRYIGIIYKVFGISVLYVAMFNSLASLGTVLCLLGMLCAAAPDRIADWQKIRFVMLLPFASYYEATPAKEAPTNFLFYLVLLLCTLLFFGKQKKRWTIGLLLLLSCILVAFLRLTALVLIALSVLGGLLATLGTWKRRLQVAAASVVFLAVLLPIAYSKVLPSEVSPWEIFDVSQRVAAIQRTLDMKMTSEDAIVGYVGSIVIPSSLADLIALAPLRVLIWTYLPFPLLYVHWKDLSSLPFALAHDFRSYMGFTEGLCAKLSSLALILLTPGVVATFRQRQEGKRPEWKFFVIVFLIAAALIANIMVFEARRYRVLLEPLFVAISLWGYAYGDPKRYARWIWPLFFVPVVAVWLVTG